MPTVPVYESQADQGGFEAPTYKGYGDTGLGEIGKGVEGLASDVAGVFEHEAQRQDSATITKSLASLRDTITNEYYNPKNGVLEKHGEAVVGGATDDALTNIKKARGDIFSGLVNERQRETFMAKSNEMLGDAKRLGDKHLALERRAVALGSLADAGQSVKDQLAAGAYADPAEAAKLIKSLEAPIRAISNSEGEANATIAKSKQDLNSLVFDAYVQSGDPDGAKQWFVAHRDDFGTAIPRVEHMLLVAQQSKENDQVAQLVVDRSRNVDENQWAHPAEALNDVDTLDMDPTRKEHVRQMVVEKLKTAGMAQDQQIASTFSRVFHDYLKKGWNGWNPKDMDWLARRAPEDYRKLQMMGRQDAEYARGLKREQELEMYPEFVKSYGEMQADMLDNGDLYAHMDPATFDRMWAAKLGKPFYDNGMQDFIKNKIASQNVAVVKGKKEISERLDEVIQADNITDPDEQTRLKGRTNVYIDWYRGAHDGKFPKRADLEEQIDFLRSEAYRKSWSTPITGAQDTVKMYELSDSDLEGQDLDNPDVTISRPTARTPSAANVVVPPADWNMAADALRRAGKPVTAANIKRLYMTRPK